MPLPWRHNGHHGKADMQVLHRGRNGNLLFLIEKQPAQVRAGHAGRCGRQKNGGDIWEESVAAEKQTCPGGGWTGLDLGSDAPWCVL